VNTVYTWRNGRGVMGVSSKNGLVLIALCIILTINAGCASPVIIGGVTGGIGALPATGTYVGRGKFESVQIARYKDVVEATSRAAQSLSLDGKKENIEEDRASFRYVDGKGQRIDVRIERRTDTVTSLRIDVGLFGTKGMGRVMLEQIIDEVAKAGGYLEDWTHGKDK
jgi:hypothetical protein